MSHTPITLELRQICFLIKLASFLIFWWNLNLIEIRSRTNTHFQKYRRDYKALCGMVLLQTAVAEIIFKTISRIFARVFLTICD